MTDAYFDGPVLVGDPNFITVNYTLKQDTEEAEVSLSSFVGSEASGVALDYTIDNGVIITGPFNP